jgi:acetyl esterase/lipase
LIGKRTFTYKVVDDCQIKADVHAPTDDVTLPAIVYIHGGCLMMGSRRGSPVLMGMLADAGYAVISIDYRLAPETKIKGIIEDLGDAFRWVREIGGTLFNIDPHRIGVVGDSAGGYLTLMSGFKVDPRPSALVSFYGYGDIDGPWYSKPDPFYLSQPMIAESTARSTVGTRTISETEGPTSRGLFYRYCRQHGLWPKEVTGYDPEVSPEVFDPLCPVRNVTSDYPSTMLLHGDRDTDVPYLQSVAMAKRLEEAGVEHQLLTMSGRGHGFDDVGFSDPIVAEALNRVLVFLKRHV